MSDALTRVTDMVLHWPADRFPDSARAAAARMLLDTMGIAVASTPMAAGVLARETALALYGSADPAFQARMLFDGRVVSLAGAGFAAATAIDNLDGHDGYNPTKGHIGVVALSALFALMQSAPDMSGPEALANIILCYEVAGRAAISLHASASDYHTSGAWNALGVVAMAARMRGMTAMQLREGLGIAEYHGPRSQMMREIATPTMLHDGSGMGAMVGISSAIMAEKGFTGAPAITVEAPEAEAHWADLGQFWQVEHQYVKPYPICRWAHAAIDGTRALMQAHGLKATDISRVEVHTFREAACLFRDIPDSTSKAQYSLPFAVATYMIHGRIGVEHIEGAGLRDLVVHEAMRRIEVVEDPRLSARFPKGRWAEVVLTLSDGRQVTSGDVHARGGPESPMSETEVLAKYDDFARPLLGATRTEALKAGILNLTTTGSRLCDLVPLVLTPVPGAIS